MESMRDIKRQIASVENTMKITRAMNMVAAAKLRKAQNRAEKAKPFFEKTRETLLNVTSKVDSGLHSLLEEREVKKEGYIIITGDRGLCGPYNNNIIKEVESTIEESDKESSLVLIGKRGSNHFKSHGYDVVSEYIEVDDNPDFSVAVNIANEIIDLYQQEVFDKVYLFYTEFKSVISHKARKMQLLPVDSPKEDDSKGEIQSNYIYEPTVSSVLNNLLPQYVKNIIFGSLLQSKASEFAARMTAMDSATENAEELIGELTLSYNRARQAAITQELSEIVGGAEALD